MSVGLTSENGKVLSLKEYNSIISSIVTLHRKSSLREVIRILSGLKPINPDHDIDEIFHAQLWRFREGKLPPLSAGVAESKNIQGNSDPSVPSILFTLLGSVAQKKLGR